MQSQASCSREAPWLLCEISRGDALGTARCIGSRSAAAGRMLHGTGGVCCPGTRLWHPGGL